MVKRGVCEASMHDFVNYGPFRTDKKEEDVDTETVMAEEGVKKAGGLPTPPEGVPEPRME